MSPLSPQPSTAVEANGSSSATDKQTQAQRPPSRPRGGSLSDRGAAVLRALARAPEDESPEDTPTGSSTPVPPVKTTSAASRHATDTDGGYSPEAQAETSPRPPADEYDASADVSRAGSIIGLTEAEKEKGRLNREGLRRRGEQREVEKVLLGKPTRKHSGDGKKKSKSWEIPRKIFHSSIGEALYLGSRREKNTETDFDCLSRPRQASSYYTSTSLTTICRALYRGFQFSWASSSRPMLSA